jgi:hypothetical protein
LVGLWRGPARDVEGLCRRAGGIAGPSKSAQGMKSAALSLKEEAEHHWSSPEKTASILRRAVL